MPRENQRLVARRRRVNGWGDLKATKGTRFLDLLPAGANSCTKKIWRNPSFLASPIRLFLISDPLPHRLCTVPCISDGELKKENVLHNSAKESRFTRYSAHLCGWSSVGRNDTHGSWFQLPDGELYEFCNKKCFAQLIILSFCVGMVFLTENRRGPLRNFY